MGFFFNVLAQNNNVKGPMPAYLNENLSFVADEK